MANNDRLFSAGIDRITPEERAWIELQLKPVNWADGTPPNWIVGDEDEDLGFAWSLDESPPYRELGEGESFLWVYAEGTGDPEEVARFVQGFLRRFRPGDHFSLTYADVCSRPRIGEFSGGAISVTSAGIRHANAYDWVEDRILGLRRSDNQDTKRQEA